MIVCLAQFEIAVNVFASICRIDENTDDIQASVEGAQKELLKYYASISSNRWLMMKIFAVIIFFFMVFVLVN
jgi:syntaxin 5